MRDFVRATLTKGFGTQLTDADLEDLSQETMLKIAAKHETFRRDSRFSTWVAAVAVNGALAELRRRRHVHVELEAATELGAAGLVPPEAPDRVQRARSAQLLREAIDTALTTRQREALLAELGGLPLAEVARRLQSDRGAVYKLLHDGRKRLRAYLQAHGMDASDLLPSPGGHSP